MKQEKEQDKINLDFDWNTEYGDGDIPDVDKNSAKNEYKNGSSQNKEK